MGVTSHFHTSHSQKVKMSLELGSSRGDLDHEVPESSSHCRLWVGKEHLRWLMGWTELGRVSLCLSTQCPLGRPRYHFVTIPKPPGTISSKCRKEKVCLHYMGVLKSQLSPGRGEGTGQDCREARQPQALCFHSLRLEANLLPKNYVETNTGIHLTLASGHHTWT